MVDDFTHLKRIDLSDGSGLPLFVLPQGGLGVLKLENIQSYSLMAFVGNQQSHHEHNHQHDDHLSLALLDQCLLF